MSRLIHFQMSSEMFERLNNAREKRDQSISGYIRWALADQLEKDDNQPR